MKKEILTKLIEHYEQCLKDISEFKEITTDLRWYISNKNIQLGICSCAKHTFETNIFYEPWVQEQCNESGYWYLCPVYCNTLTNIIYSLNFRINKMKQILNE